MAGIRHQLFWFILFDILWLIICDIKIYFNLNAFTLLVLNFKKNFFFFGFSIELLSKKKKLN